jgi:hypothetical protein
MPDGQIALDGLGLTLRRDKRAGSPRRPKMSGTQAASWNLGFPIRADLE